MLLVVFLAIHCYNYIALFCQIRVNINNHARPIFVHEASGTTMHHANSKMHNFFNVRVFYVPYNRSGDAYRRHEQAKKKREYGQRVREIERGVFTHAPLDLSTWGRMGKEAAQQPSTNSSIADMIAWKRQNPYTHASCNGMA